MIGLNFNMSFYPDGVLTTDANSNPIYKKVTEEIKTKFPKGDCITLDVSIKNAQGFIPTILMERASGNYLVNIRQPKSGDSYAYSTKYNQAYKDREYYVNKMTELLPAYIKELEADFNKNDCRNQFKKKRLQDMASALTKSASIQEQSVLGKNFKEQYLYIGIGSGILLLALYVVVKK